MTVNSCARDTVEDFNSQSVNSSHRIFLFSFGFYFPPDNLIFKTGVGFDPSRGKEEVKILLVFFGEKYLPRVRLLH